MAVIDRAFDLITQVDRANDLESFNLALRGILDHAEANALVFRERLPEDGASIASHVSTSLNAQAWFAADAATGFLDVSPVKSFLLKRKRPVTFELFQSLVRSAGVGVIADEFRRAAGMVEYTVVPIVGAGQTVGSLSVGSSHGPLSPETATLLALVAPSLRSTFFRLRRLGPYNVRVNLSPREIEVLKWSSLGQTSSDIADRLSISERTANAHVNSAINKFGVASRTQAVAEAIRSGLID